jgi:hypothetical protein
MNIVLIVFLVGVTVVWSQDLSNEISKAEANYKASLGRLKNIMTAKNNKTVMITNHLNEFLTKLFEQNQENFTEPSFDDIIKMELIIPNVTNDIQNRLLKNIQTVKLKSKILFQV